MKILLAFLIIIVSINLLLSWFVVYRLRQPTTLPLWAIKVFISALAPILLLVGLLTVLLGLVFNSIAMLVIGGVSALVYLVYIIRVTRAPDHSTGFVPAFGLQWEERILPEIKNRFLKSRYVVRLPNVPEPVINQNIVFYTIPDTNRQLLCDIWQPPKETKRSGLAFIYLHGSAWTVLDKDFGTRPFFRHLANQGHVIMDVAYRKYPEADLMGMLHDAKHAIAWMKENAAVYGINPGRIVIGGGSAGGHIALLAAYTDRRPRCTPEGLVSADLSVRGVVSLYGQSDLITTFYHTCQHLATRSALAQKKEGESGGMPVWMQKRMGADFHRLGFDKNVEPGMLAPMLGGNPDQKRDAYALVSPITYVDENCPATLILHGEHDILAPITAIRELYARLTEVGVPVVMHLIPQTDHAFDLILPKISPSAHNAIYDVERFLACLCIGEISTVTEPKKRTVYHEEHLSEVH